MKIILPVIVLLLTQVALAASYPKMPDPRLTPGSLCSTPDRLRHPEQIPYCERDVNSFFKEHIFQIYRQQLGYTLSADRALYKIDHYIPLCFGGSNNEDNLWPQHVNVGKITDPLEAIGCDVLGKGKISQSEAIELIKRAKNDLQEAPKIFHYLKALRRK